MKVKTGLRVPAPIESGPLTALADPEYQGRIDAQRVTLQFAQKSVRRLDVGKQPIADSPLFGGQRQKEMF